VALAASVCLPAAAKKYPKNKEVMKSVSSPVEDKAGYDAATELDFKRVTAEATPDELLLTVEFWMAWAEIPGPTDAEIRLYLARPDSKLFLPAGYQISIQDDGTVAIAPCSNGGTWIDDRKSKAWTAVDGAGAASLDGTTLQITLPWDALPYESLWLRLNCLHVMEIDDPDTEEVETTLKGGASNPVPSDDCPNDGKALAVARPGAS
jgi:hypothetical protein